jgi:hypothetical protein
MAGLLGDVLPYVYGRSNVLKNQLRGLLSDPVGSMQQTAGLLMDKDREMNALHALAFSDKKDPFRVTDQNALAQITGNALNGLLGMAPAGMTKDPVGRIGAMLRQYQGADPKSMPLTDFVKLVGERTAAREALSRELEGQAEGLMLPIRSGGFGGITKEARPDGLGWRLTQFDEQMAPTGHQVHKSAREALADIIKAADVARLSP